MINIVKKRCLKWKIDNPIKRKNTNLNYIVKEENKQKKRKWAKLWRLANIEEERIKDREKQRKARKAPKVRLDQSISGGMYKALKNNKNGRHWETLVNYSLQDLMNHLESKFTDGMNWANYGIWHVDHIAPKSSFIYNSYNDREFKQCWALANLQPLWGRDNRIKYTKYGTE